jgi:hypothetical protein
LPPEKITLPAHYPKVDKKKTHQLVNCTDKNIYSEIWNKFLEFESNVGDLTSIVKVEKRRSAVLENVGKISG